MNIKQFMLTIISDETGHETMNTSGNMTLNEVASSLIKIAYSAGTTSGNATNNENPATKKDIPSPIGEE